MDEIQYASERDLAIRNVDRESSLLRDVKGALRRIHDGSFGTCIECESMISPRRLAAVPWASRCIQCQEVADGDGQERTESVSATFGSGLLCQSSPLPEWRKWMNQHFYVRQGVSFQEMTVAQRNAAFGLLEASLSARGLKLTRDIMRLNETLAELINDHEFLGEWLYFITVMGKPSASEPWGFQLDGHHAIVNYFVLGDQVVMTPFFAGSEPVTAASGKYKGVSILQDEQNRGLDMLLALDKAQRAKAVLNPNKSANYNLTEAFKDNVVLDYTGARAADFSEPARKQLLDLVDLYVGNMDEGHARIKMDEVARHIGRTWFAWIGGADSSAVYYYRVHSPVILIEFDHQRPANLARFVKDPNLPTRQHIHCVLRTPNGNDYGKDILRQHYQTHAHA